MPIDDITDPPIAPLVMAGPAVDRIKSGALSGADYAAMGRIGMPTGRPDDTPESLRALADELENVDVSDDIGDSAILVEGADALRRAADRLAAADDSETIAAQAYQVIGALVFDLPETPEIVRALDYFSEGKFDEGFLPWRRDWLEAPSNAAELVRAIDAARRAGAEEMRAACLDLSRGCQHDLGFDREHGPIGCALDAEGRGGCMCAGLYAATKAIQITGDQP